MSRVIKSMVAGFVLLMGWNFNLSAQVIHIPDDRPTIQAGIDAASDGDTVLIEENTYFENINFQGKAITVASRYLVDGDTSHISRTIIDGSRPANPDSASVVTMWSGEDTTSILCGLTITGGSGTLVDSIHGSELPPLYARQRYKAGGGVMIYNSGGKIIHNRIEDNYIPEGDTVRGALGCGIFAAVNHNHRVIVRNNLIRNNSTGQWQAWGGGVGIHGGGALLEQNIVTDNRFEVEILGVGAGIFYEYEAIEGTIHEVIIRNNVITGNKALSSASFGCGGGVAVSLNINEHPVHVDRNIIAGNETTSIGGGLYSFKGSFEASGNIFYHNQAQLVGPDIGTDEENASNYNSNLMWTLDYWLVTCDSLAKLKFGKHGIRPYRPEEGIRIAPVDSVYSLDLQTAEVYLGKRSGMYHFNPDSVGMNTFVNPTVFLDFRICGGLDSSTLKKKVFRALARKHRIILPAGDNLIEFRSLTWDGHHARPDTFALQLQGHERNGYRQTSSMSAIFQKMAKGKYWLTTEWKNVEGTEYRNGIPVLVHVRLPWARTWWAILSYVLLFCLVVTLFVRIRTLRLKRETVALEREVEKRTAELRQKNEHIMEMERLKTQFFTDVSHEIRTPLTLITGPLDKLARSNNSDPKTREWLTIILRNSKRLLQLVNQLLDISRLESGQMKLVLEHSDLLKHLKVIVSQFRSLAESRHIRFVIDIPDEGITTWFDREKVTKITHNLLSNAFKFTPEKGVVTCRVRIRSEWSGEHPYRYDLRLIVADTGTGIPTEERERIFTRFYRAHHAGSDDAGGTGIGLALTRELVQLMHGEVAVRSLEGKGSVFIASFPLGKDHLNENEFVLKESDLSGSVDEEDKLAAAEKVMMRPAEEEKQEILVVEDHSELRRFIREHLSVRFTVSEASNGKEGWELAYSRLPDLVITDIMMPGLDGMELCAKLKEEERTSHIPVIMVTARAALGDRREGLVLGADDYLIKPFDIEELMIRIRNLLEQRKKLREKYSAMINMDWNSLKVTTLDEQFLKRLTGYITAHIDDFDLNVTMLKNEMNMSRENLFRKVKALTGDSPTSLIQYMRMRAAASMLEKNGESITQIALNTGYSNHSYFTKTFRKYFGMSPQEFRRLHRQPEQ